jgi:CubicO group peptidase (beta-lactamase class C family)
MDAEKAINSTNDKVVTDIRERFAGLSEERFSGAFVIANRGRILFLQAQGLEDRERGIRVSDDTRFRIGSMNKMFTAVAIVRLVQDGRVHLKDPLIAYLPDYPNKEMASKVSIHHLLSHTGGTGNIFGTGVLAKSAMAPQAPRLRRPIW